MTEACWAIELGDETVPVEKFEEEFKFSLQDLTNWSNKTLLVVYNASRFNMCVTYYLVCFGTLSIERRFYPFTSSMPVYGHVVVVARGSEKP